MGPGRIACATFPGHTEPSVAWATSNASAVSRALFSTSASPARRSTLGHGVRPRWRFPSRRRRNALLARAESHEARLLAFDARKVGLPCHFGSCAAPQQINLVSAAPCLFEVESIDGGLHFSLEHFDCVGHRLFTHDRKNGRVRLIQSLGGTQPRAEAAVATQWRRHPRARIGICGRAKLGS